LEDEVEVADGTSYGAAQADFSEATRSIVPLPKEEVGMPAKAGQASPKDVLRRYGQRFAGADLPGDVQRLREQAFGWHGARGGARPDEAEGGEGRQNGIVGFVQQKAPLASIISDLSAQQQLTMGAKEAAGCCGGADGALLCQHCGLPVADVFYADDEVEGAVVHGECKAQLVLRGLREKEEARQREEALQKKARRGKYDIGWRVERIPSNVGPAGKLTASFVKQGMCCLVLPKDTETVCIAATFEPAASVNLEYLSIALQVRRDWGREPIFSLDPVDPTNPKSKLVKHFGPSWLAGTSAGEVLFQADYYLKELSMGEHKQPVIGMRSAFDYSVEEGHNQEWSAREWFVVKKAEVHLSNDVLIPCCKMGVEAREQILDANGCLEDALLTRQDHPLVKYATVFTEKFDLIAERRSVIHNLRELAKASVLAKYLLDDKINLDETWFNLAAKAATPCCVEVPQIWNERGYSQIHLQDGEILGAEQGLNKLTRCVYGGVKFGLDRFHFNVPKVRGMLTASSQASLATMPIRRLSPPPPASTAPAAAASRRGGHELVLATPPNMNRYNFSASVRVDPSLMSINMPAAMHMTPAIARLTRVVAEAGLKGVDLDLNKFNLSTPVVHEKGDARADSFAGDCHSLDACAAVGSAFWANVRSESDSVFRDEDKHLLRDLFNPYLSDRRDEGDRFVPPDNCPLYVQQLRAAVREEAAVRQKRKALFLGSEFDACNPGPLFPSTWKSSIEITGGQVPEKLPAEQSHYVASESDEHPEGRPGMASIKAMLQNTMPVFDRSTEEGLRFRIYRLRNIEARTLQEPLEEEVVGMVCSTQESAPSSVEGKQEQPRTRRKGQFSSRCQSIIAGSL